MESHLSSSSSVTQTSSSKYRHTYKKEDRHDCNNYRGISLLSVVRKMFAHLILLCLHCFANWILPGSQARFCPNRSTLSMIFSYSSPATAREMHCTFCTYTHKMCTFLIIAASFLFFLVYSSFYISYISMLVLSDCRSTFDVFVVNDLLEFVLHILFLYVSSHPRQSRVALMHVSVA